ncbi:hypothetical protein SELMODRAFT_404293 [Selaginella moellendorffii]|uniref:Secreted protein n=1 Tax=Selaginella moellendorffii TaxID=88036 RepID=D8QUW0_SELML|nr:hypothetical protein SELMODRAFT_404293 [Selaginella moellendorffii]
MAMAIRGTISLFHVLFIITFTSVHVWHCSNRRSRPAFAVVNCCPLIAKVGALSYSGSLSGSSQPSQEESRRFSSVSEDQDRATESPTPSFQGGERYFIENARHIGQSVSLCHRNRAEVAWGRGILEPCRGRNSGLALRRKSGRFNFPGRRKEKKKQEETQGIGSTLGRKRKDETAHMSAPLMQLPQISLRLAVLL